MLKWVDIPPVWLAGALALAWVQGRNVPTELGAWANWLGGALVWAGLALIGLAIFEMMRHRTTPVPHMDADHLVTSGVFRVSRNPIYLGDSLILLGCCFRWEAVIALTLVPAFIWVIQARFIVAEEVRLRRKFVAEFELYAQQTRRWL